ncbi:MAG: hypothetical protein LBD14_04495, partial [Puniceicoccales bacterium]|nr:hypothetical protein [Puniceicoccales bacterium]
NNEKISTQSALTKHRVPSSFRAHIEFWPLFGKIGRAAALTKCQAVSGSAHAPDGRHSNRPFVIS